MTPSAQRGVFGVSYHSKRQRAAEPRKKPKRQRSPERFKREAVRPLLAVEAYARTVTAAGPAAPGLLPRSGRERIAGRSPFLSRRPIHGRRYALHLGKAALSESRRPA